MPNMASFLRVDHLIVTLLQLTKRQYVLDVHGCILLEGIDFVLLKQIYTIAHHCVGIELTFSGFFGGSLGTSISVSAVSSS